MVEYVGGIATPPGPAGEPGLEITVTNVGAKVIPPTVKAGGMTVVLFSVVAPSTFKVD